MASQEQFGAGSGSGKNGVPACPKCQGRMAVKQVSPVLFASGIDDVTYSCEACGTEIKRSVKRA